VYICGLKYSRCAKHTALDAQYLGFSTHFITNLTLAKDSKEIQKANNTMEVAGIKLEHSSFATKKLQRLEFEVVQGSLLKSLQVSKSKSQDAVTGTALKLDKSIPVVQLVGATRQQDQAKVFNQGDINSVDTPSDEAPDINSLFEELGMPQYIPMVTARGLSFEHFKDVKSRSELTDLGIVLEDAKKLFAKFNPENTVREKSWDWADDFIKSLTSPSSFSDGLKDDIGEEGKPKVETNEKPVVKCAPSKPDGNQIRLSWRVGSRLKIWSSSQSEWFVGVVQKIFEDEEGEWLDIAYQKYDEQQWRKQAQRLSVELSPLDPLEEIAKPYEFEVAFQSRPCGFDLVDSENNTCKVGYQLRGPIAKSLLEKDWIVTAVNDVSTEGSSRLDISKLIEQASTPVRIRFKGSLTSSQLTKKQQHESHAFKLWDPKKFKRWRKSPNQKPAASRESMKIGSRCQIYSRTYKKWLGGEITNIIEDEEGTWLEVTWQMQNEKGQMSNLKKQVKRDSPDIQPLASGDDEVGEEVTQVLMWCREQGDPLIKYLKFIEEYSVGWDDLTSLTEFTLQLLNFKSWDIPAVLESVDKLVRTKWCQDSVVEIWSSRNSRWFIGRVMRVFTDDDGEWLKIKYNNDTCEKEVQRFSEKVRKTDMVNDKHKALDWDSNAVSWWASKQIPPMCNWASLFMQKQVSGKNLLAITELSLLLLGVIEDDVANCQKRIEDLRMDPRMIKKIKRGSPFRLDRLDEKKYEEIKNVQVKSKWKDDHRTEGYLWEKLMPKIKRARLQPESMGWDASTVIEWLCNLGESYTAYAEVFRREQVDGEMLLKITQRDLEELGVLPLHCLHILIELEKLKTGKPYLFSAWGCEDVIDWLQQNGLANADFATIKKNNICGDLLCLMARNNLVSDLRLSEDNAQTLIDLREEYLLDRTCFGLILTEGEQVTSNVYELLRGGRITSPLLQKEHNTFTEQKLLTELTPELLQKLRTYVKTVCG